MTHYYQRKAPRASSHGLAGRPSNNARPVTLHNTVLRTIVNGVRYASLARAVGAFAAIDLPTVDVRDATSGELISRLSRGPRGGILIERVS